LLQRIEEVEMTRRNKLLITGAAVLALAAGGVGIAQAVGGDSDEQRSGPAAEKAKAAALAAVGGGSVTGVERADADGPSGGFEVEVKRADGSQVEVQIDRGFHVAGKAADDDGSADGDGPED
jgi:hypothetical protein